MDDSGAPWSAPGRAPRAVVGVAGTGPPQAGVRLLGGFGLAVGPREVELPATTQRVVALLALKGPLSRSRVAGTLWPGSSEERALGSLRTAVWRLNHAAPGVAATAGGVVRLCPSVDVDLHRFLARAAAIMEDGGPVTDVDGWAVGQGELLPDWCDEWLVPHQERVRQLQLHVLEAAAARWSRLGLYGLALQAALSALHADPLRESAHRAVISVHVAEGNVVEARRAFRQCRLLLRRELGVDPSPQTARLICTTAPLPGSPARPDAAVTLR